MRPEDEHPDDSAPQLAGISAIALATHDMPESVRFYRALGFSLTFGSADAAFSTLRCGTSYLNLVFKSDGATQKWWGRIIFHVSNVDAMFNCAVKNGFAVEAPPRDGEWGERYFHMTDPAGHELSFAKPLE